MSGCGKEIFDVFPTPMAKQLMKTRMNTAKKGHDVLEKKVQVLKMKYQKIAKEIIQTKSLLGDIFKEAAILLAEARYISGDFNQMVLNGVGKARLTVTHKTENVAGVKLSNFQLIQDGTDMFSLTGLAKGGEKLQALKQTYAHAVELLVELASLQTSFKLLDEQIKSINIRVNALDQYYIPKCKRTMEYIIEEMDDRERQDFFRLKKIKDIKKRIKDEKEERNLSEGDEQDLMIDLKDIDPYDSDFEDFVKKI
ncbi:hypothetical protein JTE90_013942 [Oedothorax gibbosus]|uniref:Vacuolar ATP synthase subunit D n=1 Tax=Oedothorax gibbosus TaxID=931172 RepID=A0AAV6UCB7_9ARAC|nr:hypothetical protein JTE90_013942 [Oedothorax gibbosus]